VGDASQLGREMPHLGQENADPNAAAARPWSHRSGAPTHDLVLEAHSQAHSRARADSLSQVERTLSVSLTLALTVTLTLTLALPGAQPRATA